MSLIEPTLKEVRENILDRMDNRLSREQKVNMAQIMITQLENTCVGLDYKSDIIKVIPREFK